MSGKIWGVSMRRTDRKRFFFALFFALIVIIPLSNAILDHFQRSIEVEQDAFTESSRELQNPRRGFYNIYAFMITDEHLNYWELVQELYKNDLDTSLSLIEINLQNYFDNAISEYGLDNIENLFNALSSLDKHLIVRFVYDWNGECEEYEPETIDIILKHMDQVENVLKKYNSQIFIVQGLFIGNWGEMNGTRYSGNDEMCRLAEKLSCVTDSSTFMAVRTPNQWRTIAGVQEDNVLAGRLSLFNDGMLGNESDYGTYKINEAGGKKILERGKELEFQEELCKLVPNGGEVINDNYYNDFERAVKDLARMHVTYLNEKHDLAVLNKWKRTEITEEGCYRGMDGYSYIERHLGYRLLIRDVNISHDSFVRRLEIGVTIENVGFAPLYSEAKTEVLLYDRDSGDALSYGMAGDLRSLPGGSDSGKNMILSVDIPVKDLQSDKYDVYFSITDLNGGKKILLANEQDAEEYGYHIGKVRFND